MHTVDLDAIEADLLRWVAERTIEMHREPPNHVRMTGGCARCQPDGGCPELAWALAELNQANGRKHDQPN